MKHLMIALMAVGVIASGALAGTVVDEDFNSGVFVSTSTREIAQTNDDGDPARYDWLGPDDSLDGWIVNDNSSDKYAPAADAWYYGDTEFDYGVNLPNADFATMPTGSHHIGGNNIADNDDDGDNDADDWASTDGNIGDYHAAFNDVPKGGWTLNTTLDEAHGGARDADGNARAFTMIYDAELNYASPDDPHGLAYLDAEVTLGSESVEVDSPWFYGDAGPADVPDDAVDITDYSPAANGIFDTDDDADLAPAARGITSGVIELAAENGVADGDQVRVWTQVGRPWDAGTGGTDPVHMGIGMDNLQVVALEPGDANGDLEVGLSDFAALGQNFGSGTTWTEGDFNFDDAVDLSDFAALGQNFGLTYGEAAAEAAAETGEMDLIVDVTTGEAWLDIGEDVTTTGYQIKSADGDLLPDEFTGGLEGLDVPPAGNTETSIAQFALSSVDAPAGELSLGGIFDESGDGTDLTFSWTDGDFNESSGNVVIIPEPATMALLGLGGLAMIRRRR